MRKNIERVTKVAKVHMPAASTSVSPISCNDCCGVCPLYYRFKLEVGRIIKPSSNSCNINHHHIFEFCYGLLLGFVECVVHSNILSYRSFNCLSVYICNNCVCACACAFVRVLILTLQTNCWRLLCYSSKTICQAKWARIKFVKLLFVVK